MRPCSPSVTDEGTTIAFAVDDTTEIVRLGADALANPTPLAPGISIEVDAEPGGEPAGTDKPARARRVTFLSNSPAS